jgi:ferredoxin
MNIDPKKCVGCSNCIPVCPMGAIYIGEDRLARINSEACVECYTCYRGMGVENLSPTPVRFIRRMLAAIGLRFQPDPDICPTGALIPSELTWPRTVRRAFSDPTVPHDLTGIEGRGTAEVKTNDVTGRVKEGEAGFVVELGRPGVGVYFREVEKVTLALASQGVEFEKQNPVTGLMVDPKNGHIREDVLNEKILSCILETKVVLGKVPQILDLLKEIAPTLNTVLSVGVSARCDAGGEDPIRQVLIDRGYEPWRAKVNLGMGRPAESSSEAMGANP